MRQKDLIPEKIEKIVWDTGKVILALRKLYHEPEHAMLTEVGNSTGFSCQRHADAVAMSLWPSRGLQIIGFEVKASRTDWIKELLNGGKADVIYGYCDLWFLAVGDERIVRDGELPPTWGLLVPRKDGFLHVKVPATHNAAVIQPDRGFIAAMLRRASEQLTDKAQLAAEYERGAKEGEERHKRHAGYCKDELEELHKKVQKFERASGVSIENEWDTEEVGHAVRMVRNGMSLRLMEQLGRLETSARQIADNVADQMKILREDETRTIAKP